MLGVVDKNSTIRYAHEDIEACREFLRMMGLKCTLRGWVKEGWIGSLHFFKGEWHAAVSRVAE